MNKLKIVVLGGGSAGWLTALFIKKFINCDVILIESEEIGILGAGEGTTPNFVNFIQSLGINIEHLIKETSGTLKNGISFERWNADDEKDIYLHGFNTSHGILKPFSEDHQLKEYAFGKNLSNDIYNYAHKISYMNKVPFVMEKNNQINGPFSNFGVHFDAKKLVNFLKKISIDRDIIRKEGKLKQIINDKNEYIEKIILEDGEEIELDFIFDCSGFKRKIIGEHYHSKWIDCGNILPIKKAIPFFLPQSENEIISYTKAVAMKNGWLWMIPLQERFGCGYLYDDNYINDDEAKKEIDVFFGKDVELRGKFSFNPGYYDRVWIKNCISLGLSSGFFEPLEATSIFSFIVILPKIIKHIEAFEKNDNFVFLREEFNRTSSGHNEDILEFLYLHYLGERQDSPFWQEFKTKNKMPLRINEILEKVENRKIFEHEIKENNLFSFFSYLTILKGINKIKNQFYGNNFNFYKMNNFNKYIYTLNDIFMNSISHKYYLNIINNKTHNYNQVFGCK
jgi:tryptophan halogenase